ncbi:MAG: PAQR family membrane homeostasis protein TrhA [Sodalis sp. (in: enterobacteria)]
MGKKTLAKKYSLAEEIANSISHGVGVIFSIVGLVLMLKQAREAGANTLALTSYSLYGSSVILLYLASMLYHAVPYSPAKFWLKKIDHCAIYLLIAGTYTPFLLVGLASPSAKWLMLAIWLMASVGIILKVVLVHRFNTISIIAYLAMGWLSLVVIYQLVQRLPAGGVALLAAGGVIYSLGVIFYVLEQIPFNHAIWHVFVLGGSICHFLSIYLFVI